MAVEIKMPQLSDTMDAGKILTWNKQEGDKITRGDILAEVETDKANLEIESFHGGFLIKIVVPEGQSANVGEAIAFIGEQDESVDVNASNGSSASSPAEPKEETTTTTSSTPAPSQTPDPAPIVSAPSPSPSIDSDKIKASPLARKLANQNNVDLAIVQGTGPNGRIIKKDVEQAAQGESTRPSTSAPATTPRLEASSDQAVTSKGGGRAEPLSKMRATIARRMQQAVQEAPHFYTTISIDMSESLKLRSVFKADPELKEVSINHLIIKAAAYALKREPGVNAALQGENIFYPDQINIGVITAVEGGLMIPVIKTVDQLHLKDLAFETRAAIERARAGRPSATDLSGGTFSISNMGMFGVENFTAIINPGQGAILAVGATLEQAVVKNNVVQAAPIMQVTLSVDHRIIDGTMSGQWLTHFKQALEQPAIVLL